MSDPETRLRELKEAQDKKSPRPTGFRASPRRPSSMPSSSDDVSSRRDAIASRGAASTLELSSTGSFVTAGSPRFSSS
jgi:hypothetical protein